MRALQATKFVAQATYVLKKGCARMKIRLRKSVPFPPEIFPDHLADLRISGLTDETIRASGLFSILGSELYRFVERNYRCVKSALVFPYGNGFFRMKLFPPLRTADGKTIRYLQPSGTQPRFYIPRLTEPYLLDPKSILYITEGEKKALAANQNGIPTIAIPGVWSWLSQGRPIDDFNLIAWKGRRVCLVGDADIWLSKREDLRKAVFALCKEIERRGAVGDLIVLPEEDLQ